MGPSKTEFQKLVPFLRAAHIIKWMLASDDMHLLQEYATGHSEEAFSALVSRHINLVYSAVLRSVNNSHQAEDVTQAVFVTLARKSGSLRRGTVLSGWLYQAARLTAANFLRTELHRRHREQQTYMQSTLNDPEPDVWPQVGPLLEDAMAQLNEKERNAIVLRFFEAKPLKEVGEALGTSEDAAKMRVNRALEKLRHFFHNRGIAHTAAALAAAISGNSVQAAPAGLAAAVAAGACQCSALTTSTLILVKGTVQIMTWVKTTAALAAATIIALQWQQHSSGKQHLKQVEEQVAQQMELNRAQGAELARIKRLDASLAGAMQDMEIQRVARDVARARARASATRAVPPPAASIGIASPSTVNTNTIDQILMQDPDLVKTVLEHQASQLKMQYAPLVKQLMLTAEQAGKFYQVLLGGTNAQSESSLLSAPNGAEGWQSAALQYLKQQERDLQALLGDAGYAAYNDYKQTVGDRDYLSTLKNYFTDNPLGEDQQQRLLQVMVAARQSVEAGSPLDYSQPNAGLQQQEQINQQVLAQAAAFLSPEQLQTLGSSQSNLLGMQRISMALGRALNSPTNAPAGP